MDFLNSIEKYFSVLKATMDKIDKKQIDYFAGLLIKHYEADSCIFIFGNGGSGATASHAVCDFNKGTCLDLDKKFKFICLNDNTPSISAYSNDVSYEDIFYMQLKNYMTSRDLVIGISGSGNSKNVIKAIEYARQKSAKTFTLCGFNGGRLKEIDGKNCIHVPIDDMQITEDIHYIIFHVLMQVVSAHLHRR